MEQQHTPAPSSEYPLFPRELSWLAFNGRVLQEAADTRLHAIEAVEEDHAGDPQQRRGRHVVPGQCQAVLEATDATAGRVEIVHGSGF